MTPGAVSRRVVGDRLATVDDMLTEIRALPLDEAEAFHRDTRNVWTVDACLRRALEALLDAGRHILARGFAVGATEYKQIAEELGTAGVLDARDAGRLRTLAGYRNRLVHFYHEIGPDELLAIARHDLDDVAAVRDALAAWLRDNPDRVDNAL